MTNENILVKMVLDAWRSYIKRTDELFNTFSDEQLMKEIAPGKNRGIYLLGHLAAIFVAAVSFLSQQGLHTWPCARQETLHERTQEHAVLLNQLNNTLLSPPVTFLPLHNNYTNTHALN